MNKPEGGSKRGAKQSTEHQNSFSTQSAESWRKLKEGKFWIGDNGGYCQFRLQEIFTLILITVEANQIGKLIWT